MQSKQKTNSVITTGYDEPNMTWIFTVAGVGTLRLKRGVLNSAITERALIEGMSDRIVDKAALGFNKEEGRYATPREKYDAMAALIEHYATGTSEWSMRLSDGSGAKSSTIEALARVQGVSYDEAEAMVVARAEKLGITRKAQLAKVAKLGAVQKAMLAIRAERIAARGPAVDSSELNEMLESVSGESA